MVDFIVTATVTISDVAQENARVILRNESSGASQSLNTNSLGKAIFSANNFTGGWKVGEILTLAVIYTSYESSSSHTITVGEGGWTQTLALTAVTVSDLNYCTIQDVYDYLSWDSNTAEGNITAERIRSIGLRIEDQIERRTNSIFHTNDGSYTTVTDEYMDVRNVYQSYFFLQKRPIQELKHFEINTVDESAIPAWNDLAYTLIDACDSVTGWSGTTDSGTSTLYTDLSDIKEGDAAINLIKSGATQSSVTWSKAMTSIDSNDRTLHIWYHIDDTDDLVATGTTAVRIIWGNDASNYFYKDYDMSDLSDDWNDLSLDVTAPTGETGSPDRSALDYFAITVTYVAATTTKAAGTQMIDYIRVGSESDVKYDPNTGRCTVNSDLSSITSGARMIKATYTYGHTSVPEDIKQLTILMIVRDLMRSNLARAVIEGKTEFTAPQAELLNTQIDEIFKRWTYDHMINI